MILGDFLKALNQMFDRRFVRVMALGIGLSLALLFGIYAVLLGAIDLFVPGSIAVPFVGEIGGITALVGWGSLVVMLVLSIFLMMPVASAFAALFLDEVTDAVEARHYPGLPPAPGLGLIEGLIDTLGFLGLLLAVNLLSLALWAFTGPVMPLITWALNGYLLGREYFTMVAARRLGRAQAQALRQRHAGQVWLAGVLMAAPLAMPLVNLVVPVLGVATFTHMVHRLNKD